MFTLEHLKANKLRYLHNGNEDIVDSFVFEMEIKVVISTITKKTIIDDIIMTIIQLVILMVLTIQGPDGLDLPLALTIRQRFLFEIRILPVNDPPRLTGDSTFFSLLCFCQTTSNDLLESRCFGTWLTFVSSSFLKSMVLTLGAM